MQFNMDEMFDNIGSSPSIIDVSSESGEEFARDLQALNKKFGVGGPSTDAMSAFVDAAAATLPPTPRFSSKPKMLLTPLGLKSRGNC